MAEAPPPPLQILASPILAFFSRNMCVKWTTRRHPEALVGVNFNREKCKNYPIGCPRATPPPFTFNLFNGISSNYQNVSWNFKIPLQTLALANATTLKASLISQKSTSSFLIPAFWRAFGTALAGAIRDIKKYIHWTGTSWEVYWSLFGISKT